MGMVYKPSFILSHHCLLKLVTVSKAVPTSMVSFGKRCVWFQKLNPRMLSIDAVAVRIRKLVKFVKLKTDENLS